MTARILIYSHDTFGLGHLRRCNTIAQALVERHDELSVLILSGSPIIGSFEFRPRVDFVRIPGVIKLRDGDYSSLSLHMDIGELLKLRASIIRHTAEAFQPDVFIVDKEPQGLRGEILDTLRMLKRAGTRCVLGLRDVMDEPALLAREWQRKNPVPALRDLYDDIWVYGLPQICDPLAGIDVPNSVRRKVTFTGYLRRAVAPRPTSYTSSQAFDEPYILVTTGGGGDGEDLTDLVLRAYEADPGIPFPALLLFGPFMAQRLRADFRERVARLQRVEAITFDTHVEELIANAAGVVSMGGYNTFCEILSLDKRALVLPRLRPRMEQYIRTSRAQNLGLLRMLDEQQAHDPLRMAQALRRLPEQPLPSEIVIPGLLDGLDNIHDMVGAWIANNRRVSLSAAARGA